MTSADKILFLGAYDSPLLHWLISEGEVVHQTSDQITLDFVKRIGATFIISYNYSYILKKEILLLFPDKALNLHISYLPWNRGDHPNFWSFIDNTPKGVTIHHLDARVDTGDIIAQKEVVFPSDNQTLSTTYKRLHDEIQTVFKQNWTQIKKGQCKRIKQSGKGSYHKSKDMQSVFYLLPDGWDTPIPVLELYADKIQQARLQKT